MKISSRRCICLSLLIALMISDSICHADFYEGEKYIIANPAENVGYYKCKPSEQFVLEEDTIFTISEQDIDWEGIKVNKILLESGEQACVPAVIFSNIVGNGFRAIPYSLDLKKEAVITLKKLQKQGVKQGVYIYSSDWEDDTPPFYKYKVTSLETMSHGNVVIHTAEDVDLAIGSADDFQRRYVLKLPKWPKRVLDQIRQRKVSVGMTRDQVIASWGEPESKNRSVGRWGINEQWIYGRSYLYFENGKMTSYQD